MTKPTIICVTPVRNERWILEKFLRAASLWADHIIIADQSSDDGSIEIARSFPKVRLILNPSAGYDEASRRDLLMAAARELPGPRLIFGLDADELLSADLFDSPEWESVLTAPLGTTIWLQWANLYSSFSYAHVFEHHGAFAYMDDGKPIDGTFIHSPRIPNNPKLPGLRLTVGKVLHYQYLDWDRMKAKHRWYQCIERVKYPSKSAAALYRQYHHMDVSWARRNPIQPAWFEGYTRRGIDARSLAMDPHPYFERETLQMLSVHGSGVFRRLDIWDVDWVDLARFWRFETPGRFGDPRGPAEWIFNRWMRATQDYAQRGPIRFLDKVARKLGW